MNRNPPLGPPSVEPGKAVSQSHQAWLTSEVERLETLIRPAEASVVDEAIDLILEGHGGRKTNETRAKAYLIAIEGFSAKAIGLAVRDVLRNQAGTDPDWAPTAPRLADLCRGHEDRMRSELARRHDDLRALIAPPEKPLSPEERTAFACKFDGLLSELRANAAKGRLDELAASALSNMVAGDVERDMTHG